MGAGVGERTDLADGLVLDGRPRSARGLLLG